MWLDILLIILAVAFLWWLSRTSLFRHWRRHGADPGQHHHGDAPGQMGGYLPGEGAGGGGARDRDAG